MRKRLLRALCYTFGAMIISIMILFISWAVFKNVNLPYDEISINMSNAVDSSTAISLKPQVVTKK